METAQDKAYEALYYSLWELAQRYSEFTQFRVIGKSHDERLIPMLEIGILHFLCGRIFGYGWKNVGHACTGSCRILQNI